MNKFWEEQMAHEPTRLYYEKLNINATIYAPNPGLITIRKK